MLKKKLIIVSHILIGIIFFAAFWIGYCGIDFGHHWDEGKMIDAVARSFNEGLFLQRRYNYPSVSYRIALLGTIPDIMQHLQERIQGQGPIDGIRAALVENIESHRFLLRTRTLFLAVTLLSYIWTYFLILLWRNSGFEALLGVAILGSSWEVAYHARWIAPDGILMQFGILTVLISFVSVKNKNHKIWLMSASIIAGITCGAKYPGGVMLLPVLLTGVRLRRKCRVSDKGIRNAMIECVILTALFGVAFLVSTPGTLLDPFKFVHDLQYEMNHYRTGHPGFTVESGLEHGLLLFRYLCFVALSKYWPISLSFFLLACLGTYFVIRDNIYDAVIFIGTPLIYTLYMSFQTVMFVRNYLILVPFMAVLAARGVAQIMHTMPKYAKTGFISLVVFMILISFSWQIVAAHSINKKIDYRSELLKYIRANPEQRFFLSLEVASLISGTDLKNRSEKTAKADTFVFMAGGSIETTWNLEANRFKRYQIVAGSYEVNFNYYPQWGGILR